MLNSNQTIKTQFANMVNTSVLLMNASIEGFKQASFVQCEAMNNLVQGSLNTVKDLSLVTTPAAAVKCMQQHMTKSVESYIASAKELSAIINNTKSIYSVTGSATIKNAQDSLVKSVKEFSAISPAFSKVANASIENFISTSNQAADAAGKVSAQMTEVATKNIEAATKATLANVKKAAAKAATVTK